VAQALALLSDRALKLYIHLCLEAGRHTGRVWIADAHLAGIPASILGGFSESQSQGICERHGNQVGNL
jgi:hypothetical protein